MGGEVVDASKPVDVTSGHVDGRRQRHPDTGVVAVKRRDENRRRGVYATILTLGVIYILICASYGTFETLQSTINVSGGLGTTAIGVLYATAILSSLLAAPTIVARLGPRRTLCVGWAMQAFYAVANAFPRWETLVPASAAIGLMFGATSIVYGVYVTTMAEQAASTTFQTTAADVERDDPDSTSTDETGYAAADQRQPLKRSRQHRSTVGSSSVGGGSPPRLVDNAVVRINSILLAFVNVGSVTGSLIGSLVVGMAADNHPTTTAFDNSSSGSGSVSWTSTSTVDDDPYNASSMVERAHHHRAALPPSSVCGVDHCPYLAEHVSGFEPADRRLVYLVAGIAMAFNVVAFCVTAVVLRPPPGSTTSTDSSPLDRCCRRLLDRTRRRRAGGDGRSTAGNRRSHDDDAYIATGSNSGSSSGDGGGGPMLSTTKCDGSRRDGAASREEVEEGEGGEERNGDGVESGEMMTSVDDEDRAAVVTASPAAAATMSVRTRIVETFRLMGDRRLQLLIPSVMLMGVINSFSVGAFNQSFVACLLGINYIGYATLCFRGSLIVFSLLAGQLAACVRRRTLVLAAQFVMAAAICSWFVPLPAQPVDAATDSGRQSTSSGFERRHLLTAVVLTWCAVNGAVYGLLRSAVFALFPLLFRRNLHFALAHCNIWESFGAAVTFFVNDWFCFGVKAYAFAALTAVSVATYVALECVISDSAGTAADRQFVIVVGGDGGDGGKAAVGGTTVAAAMAKFDSIGRLSAIVGPSKDPFVSVSASLMEGLNYVDGCGGGRVDEFDVTGVDDDDDADEEGSVDVTVQVLQAATERTSAVCA